MCKYCSSIIWCSTKQDDLKMTEYHVWCESLVNDILRVKFYLNISATTAMCKGCLRDVKISKFSCQTWHQFLSKNYEKKLKSLNILWKKVKKFKFCTKCMFWMEGWKFLYLMLILLYLSRDPFFKVTWPIHKFIL